MIVCSNIRKSFGSKEVIHGIDLRVAPGEITAIIGPSGGGKSTLLRAISMLDPPDAGTISIDDKLYSFPTPRRSVTRPPWPALTVVFQQLFLWPHLTLKQNIMLPLEQKLNAALDEVDDLIDLFDLRELVGRYPNQVSLGQRQRAAFVRALALQPTYLLLDEITSALDVEHVGRILDHLQTLKGRGTGVLLVTHLIGFAKSAADQIIFMEEGNVIASGGPELLTIDSKNLRLHKFLSLVETAA